MQKQGFRTDKTDDGAFGHTQDYTVLIRCDSEDQIVFITVAGPVSKKTEGYLQALEKDFR